MGIDIVMSTGAGKPRESEERTTIYKRSYDNFYRVKRKTSKDLLWKINKKYPSFPFTLRYFDEKKVNFGIKEIADHELVNPYPSVVEKEGELVCQTKFTALLLPSGTKKICGLEFNVSSCESEFKLDDELNRLMLLDLGGKTYKKKKKKNKNLKMKLIIQIVQKPRQSKVMQTRLLTKLSQKLLKLTPMKAKTQQKKLLKNLL